MSTATNPFRAFEPPRNLASTMQREYYQRPDDERFPNVRALADSAREDRELSREVSYSWRDLHWEPTGTDRDTAGLQLVSPKASAALTHWSFGQAARMLGAPAGHYRDALSPEIAAAALNYRISEQPHGAAPVLLVRAPNGRPLPQIRAVTSETYGRVWDHDLYSSIDRVIGGTLQAPPTWERHPDGTPKTGGAYRGDRDSSAVLIAGGSIVTDPSARSGRGDGAMYRGLIVRNSEVGACAVHLYTFLYRAICGNHLIMGIEGVQQYSRRHVGPKAQRDVVQAIAKLARQITQAGTAQDEQVIRLLIDREIAHTRDAVISELQKAGWTKEQATTAYDTCEATEQASPRSFWGIAQGATRASQQTPYMDERLTFDQLAGQLLTKGRKLVAA